MEAYQQKINNRLPCVASPSTYAVIKLRNFDGVSAAGQASESLFDSPLLPLRQTAEDAA